MVAGIDMFFQIQANFDLTTSLLITQFVFNFVAHFSDFNPSVTGTAVNRFLNFLNWGIRHHDPILFAKVFEYLHTEAARMSALNSSARVCG